MCGSRKCSGSRSTGADCTLTPSGSRTSGHRARARLSGTTEADRPMADHGGAGEVVIDCFPERLSHYGPEYAVVAVDVIRANTTAMSAAVLGRRCFPAASLPAATELAARVPGALLAGELRGEVPDGFDLDNSPAAISARTDVDRPLV